MKRCQSIYSRMCSTCSNSYRSVVGGYKESQSLVVCRVCSEGSRSPESSILYSVYSPPLYDVPF